MKLEKTHKYITIFKIIFFVKCKTLNYLREDLLETYSQKINSLMAYLPFPGRSRSTTDGSFEITGQKTVS